jgi:hypothetical protein
VRLAIAASRLFVRGRAGRPGGREGQGGGWVRGREGEGGSEGGKLCARVNECVHACMQVCLSSHVFKRAHGR